MKSLAIFPEKKKVETIDQPALGKPGPFEVKLKVLEVGICGTDREISAFEYGTPSSHSDHLVLGHEALAEVVEIGEQVETLKAGDLVVPTVRRPCAHKRCWACQGGRQDFCLTGDFTERGIKEADGFLSEFAIEDESNLVHLPKELAEVGVLVEPLSIATKAGQQLVAIQERFPFRHLKLRGLVLGAGPVGILAGMVLRVHGYETFIYSSESESSDRADLVRSFGAKYVSAKKTGIESLRKEIGTVDVIYEAVGITEVAFRSLDVLGPNGVCILTGIPGQSDIGQVDMGQIMRNLVLKNQLVLGTVNAGTAAYESAVSHLEQFMFLFPESVRKLISRHPMTETPELLKRKKGIKDIIRISA